MYQYTIFCKCGLVIPIELRKEKVCKKCKEKEIKNEEITNANSDNLNEQLCLCF